MKVGGTATADARLEFQKYALRFLLLTQQGPWLPIRIMPMEWDLKLGTCVLPGVASSAGGCNLVMINGLDEEKAQAAWTFFEIYE